MNRFLKTAALAMMALTIIAAGRPRAAYHVVATIPGPDAAGWDYARVDSVAHRLYIARSASVTVIDTQRELSVGSIGAIAHGHAVLPLSGGRLLVTSGQDASVRFLSASDGRELGRATVGAKPDAAILSDDGETGFVMNAEAGSVSVIDTTTMRVTRTVPLKPGLEYAALGPNDTLFVNNEDANEIDRVDARRGTAAKPIALPGCVSPSGLAYDAKSDRLVAACANGKAAIVRAADGKLVQLVEIGAGPDAVILDPQRRLAFIPCGKDGVLDILSVDGPAVKRIDRIKTAAGARTGALDPESGAIYLPTASFDPPARPGTRPTAKPGTFKVLVVKPA
ncbi:YVTN family beta-propeller protein [Novosphingobium capsulatum]|uniref:YVTN family beta-propeller protein n=1 Tax=Novosphingobium capsulatum TaxID=13688 RepID=A0ABU1MSB3_9SPHN|nr:gluconolactonase [Novosphingobium capsulatum]MDR6513162.1 YVTN family beta-propeller protein [Novosphingobium capsulatum]